MNCTGDNSAWFMPAYGFNQEPLPLEELSVGRGRAPPPLRRARGSAQNAVSTSSSIIRALVSAIPTLTDLLQTHTTA